MTLRRHWGARSGVAALALCAAVLGCSSAPSEAPPAGSSAPAAVPAAAPATAPSRNCAGVQQHPGTAVALAEVATGFERPVHMSSVPDGSGRMVVLEQAGLARLGSSVGGEWTEWLDLRERVTSEGEQGLLSLAFHPAFKENGRLFVYYTVGAGDVVLSEFRVSRGKVAAGPDLASERTLIRIDQRFSNHFAGQLVFGPDGFLYVGIGDGGSEGDPDNNGQRLDSLLGKILRLDVDSKVLPYGIPADNPFVRVEDALPEIWAFGLRNPWRFSFDRKNSRMWIADVGSLSWEEVSIGVKGGNYGWKQLEGRHCFVEGCDPSSREFIAPVWEYGRDRGMSVTGGFVYRGCKLPDLQGLYIFSDYQHPDSPLWSLRFDGERATSGPVDLVGTGAVISSFGEDEDGELYVLDHLRGRLLRLESAGSPAP